MQAHALISPPLPTEAECYQLLMENVVDYAIFTLDIHHHIVTWNAGAERILAYEEAEIVGKPFEIIYLEDRAQGVPDKEVHQAKVAGRANDERWHRRKRGLSFWAVGILTALYEESGELRGFVKILRDMTAHKTAEDALQRSQAALVQTNEQLQQRIGCIHEQAEELQRQKADLQETNARLETLATTDGLTGLKNHRAFQERLREEMERAVRYRLPLSLLLLDVDYFKSYNDTFGHLAGDVVLQQVAEVLQATARTTDLAARYGGEEFAVILPETNTQEAKAADRGFRWQSKRLRGRSVRSRSVGDCYLVSNCAETATFVQEADIALYRAKERGRNCFTHTADAHHDMEMARS